LAAPIDTYVAAQDPVHPGIYTARTSLGASWLGTPATYYWQTYYVDDDDGDTYASAVRAVKVIAQPPPDAPAPPVTAAPAPVARPSATAPRPPDEGTVRIAVRRAIHAATRMVPRRLVPHCTRAPAAATCRPSWRDVRARYRGTLHLTFGASAITATFRGIRAPRRHGHARAVTWATSL
jgi:hypothetical protein